MDGGLASDANKTLLRDKGFHFLVNDKRTTRGAWATEFKAEDFQSVPDRVAGQEVRVRLLELPERGERLVLCKSAGRKAKEGAIRSGAEIRFLQDLEKLRKRLDAGRLKDANSGLQALGRLRERHSRIARYYELALRPAEGGGLKLECSRDDQFWKESGDLAGDYVLRTSRMDLDAVEIWELYMTLTRAEDGFRLVKSNLGLRPNYHQKDAWVDTHAFITILAYQLLRFILHTLEKQGDTRSWPVLRRMLLSHCYSTILLPTTNGRLVRVRKPGRPELCQQAVYAALGISGHRGLPVTVTTVDTPAPPDNFVVTQKTDR
jgi:hypothetical protein